MVRTRFIALQQLDARVQRIRRFTGAMEPPPEGWIAALRSALGMSQAVLAARMGVRQQAVSQLEAREIAGGVTLDALREAARALDGELIYAIVPPFSIRASLEAHAVRVADERTESGDEARRERLVKALIYDPRKLWRD